MGWRSATDTKRGRMTLRDREQSKFLSRDVMNVKVYTLQFILSILWLPVPGTSESIPTFVFLVADFFFIIASFGSELFSVRATDSRSNAIRVQQNNLLIFERKFSRRAIDSATVASENADESLMLLEYIHIWRYPRQLNLGSSFNNSASSWIRVNFMRCCRAEQDVNARICYEERGRPQVLKLSNCKDRHNRLSKWQRKVLLYTLRLTKQSGNLNTINVGMKAIRSAGAHQNNSFSFRFWQRIAVRKRKVHCILHTSWGSRKIPGSWLGRKELADTS